MLRRQAPDHARDLLEAIAQAGALARRGLQQQRGAILRCLLEGQAHALHQPFQGRLFRLLAPRAEVHDEQGDAEGLRPLQLLHHRRARALEHGRIGGSGVDQVGVVRRHAGDP